MSILRQDIVDAMKTRFALIATTTYHNTLSGKVFTHYAMTPPSGLIVNIKDTDEKIDDHLANVYWDRTLTVEIGIETDGTASDTTIRTLIEDIWKSIGTDRTWSGKAIDTTAVSSSIEVQHEEKRIAGASLTIEVLYRTGAWAES